MIMLDEIPDEKYEDENYRETFRVGSLGIS